MIALAIFAAFLPYIVFCLFPLPKPEKERHPVDLTIVLGSGGHTGEMLKLLKGVQFEDYSSVSFIAAASDVQSLEMLEAASLRVPYRVHLIPRSRHVGQSWISSVFTAAWSFLYCFFLMARLKPHLIVCNGPGTCLPPCIAARLLTVGRARIVFVESICRVISLSLTGKLLYPISDRFIVQWEELQQRYPGAEYLGVIT